MKNSRYNFPTSWLSGLVLALLLTASARAWWDPEWTSRKKITVDTSAKGAEITGPIGSTTVLIRLFDGNFQFASAKEDGGDIRFVAEDDKTLLPFHIEKYDAVLNEAFVWVKLPDVKPGAVMSFWLYSGNAGPKAVRADDAKKSYDADTTLVYHFAESGSPAGDSSPAGNNAENAGVPSGGSMIGGGLLLDGKSLVSVPVSPSLTWSEGANVTWSAWIKPSALQPNAVLFTRRDAGKSFVIGVDNGSPYVEIGDGTSTKRSSAGAPLTANTWKHLAVVATSGKITVYLGGEIYSSLDTSVPALNSPLWIGTPKTEGSTKVTGFNGELDELEISKTLRSAGLIKLQAINQGGGEAATRLLQFAADEASGGGGEPGFLGKAAEHLGLFVDIGKNMMFDGWCVIFFCAIMACTGWTVAIRKFMYLNKIKKGTEEFLRQWKSMSTDLTALDHTDAASVSSLGGTANPKVQRLMKQSPIYHIYHIGSEEIRHRLQSKQGFNGLSARSMQAIKASLDSGLTHEVHRLNDGLIFLTISIAGGPYLGLLGTVIGVMVTFAVIAKSGEVEVNSIAPGIAGALLATVAGLIVAIPALFIYSFLNSQIKDVVSNMQLFIDEFIAKMAEFYPTPAEGARPIPVAEYAVMDEEANVN
jgi:biopolymer transport protein ExbB